METRLARGFPATRGFWLERVRSARLAEFWVILGLACFIEAAWFALMNVTFFYDSVSYLNYALALFGNSLDWGVPWVNHEMVVAAFARRTGGYPLLLLLTGATNLDSFLGILLLQAAMAVALPLLVFKTLEPYSRRAAFVTALVVIFSLEPFTYSKVLSSDQSFKFLLMLLVYLASSAYRVPSRWIFCALTATALILTLVRPQGSVICLAVFAMLLIAHGRWWKSIVGGFAVLGLILAAVSFATVLYVVPDIPTEMYRVAKDRLPQTLGDRFATLLFYDVYFARNGDLAPSGNDTARRDLRTVLDAYAREHTAEWPWLEPKAYFGDYAADPKAWVDQIYRNPNPFYLTVIRMAVATAAQSPDAGVHQAAHHLIARLDRDMYRHRPHYIISFVLRTLLAAGTSTTGEQIFDQQYTSHLSGRFSAQNGPASAEIVHLMRIYFRDFPSYLPPFWRRDHTGIDEALDTLSVHPDEGYWYFLWDVVDRMRGRLEGSSLFFRATKEFPDFYYNKMLRFIDNIGEFLVGSPTNYQSGAPGRFDDEARVFLLTPTVPELPAGLRAQIAGGMRLIELPVVVSSMRDYDKAQLPGSIETYIVFWLFLRTSIMILILATFLFAFRAGNGWLTLLCGGIIAYQAIVVSFLTDVYIRYVDQIMPLAILLAGLTVTSLIRIVRERDGMRQARRQTMALPSVADI